MITISPITTAEELLQAPDRGPCELVRGELQMMTPAGFEHGGIAAEITWALKDFVKRRGLGMVTGAETGFQIGHDPDTVRAPDVAFVRADRLPNSPARGYYPGAPDLAVEVLSPGDRAGEVLAKVGDWLDAGCRLVWIVDPSTQTVTAYRSRREIVVLTAADVLDGGEVLPGFSYPVGEVFAA